MAAVVAEHGPWTAHNIRLGGRLSTIGPQLTGDELRAKRIVRVVGDVCRTDFRQLRVLDLGCLEGLYGIEFARVGADVLGIDGREENIAKAQFSKEALGLENIRFVVDDVRHLSPEKYGSFDVVLCLGILYHLDVPDAFEFVEACARSCTRMFIADTHVSLSRAVSVTHRGKAYAGRRYQEHPPHIERSRTSRPPVGLVGQRRKLLVHVAVAVEPVSRRRVQLGIRVQGAVLAIARRSRHLGGPARRASATRRARRPLAGTADQRRRAEPAPPISLP